MKNMILAPIRLIEDYFIYFLLVSIGIFLLGIEQYEPVFLGIMGTVFTKNLLEFLYSVHTLSERASRSASKMILETYARM